MQIWLLLVIHSACYLRWPLARTQWRRRAGGPFVGATVVDSSAKVSVWQGHRP